MFPAQPPKAKRLMAPTSLEREHSLTSGQTGEPENPVSASTPLRNKAGCGCFKMKALILLLKENFLQDIHEEKPAFKNG